MRAIIAPAFSRLILITQFNNNISIPNEMRIICNVRGNFPQIFTKRLLAIFNKEQNQTHQKLMMQVTSWGLINLHLK